MRTLTITIAFSVWMAMAVTAHAQQAQLSDADYIKPNDRLTSVERLEIYNRQYWFRVLDCLYDDYPGLRAILGQRKFMKLATAYLARYPSDSYTLRDLGNRLEQFLHEEPQWSAPRQELARDMVRFEWAQVVAFDGPAKPPVAPDDILDAPPSKLRLDLQPYLSLLELDYAVDDFLIAVKKRDSDALRGEASNAVQSAPKAVKRRKRIRPPKREKVYLAVHRHETRICVQREALEDETRVASCASRDGIDPGEQLCERERLDEIIIGAAAQSADAILQASTGGEHQNRQRILAPPYLSQDREAVSIG